METDTLEHDFVAPSRWQRFAALVYEGMLLFGVLFIAGYIFDTLTQSTHALTLRHERMTWFFFVLGVYFVWFWQHGGQTLAMKTWHIRLIRQDGSRIGFLQSIARYLLSYIFTLTGLSFLYSYFDPQSQFPHDRLLKTRLVCTQPKGN